MNTPEILNASENLNEIKNLLSTIDNDVKAILTIRTSVKMNKKDVATKSIENPNGEIFKVATIDVTLNPSYEKAVNEQRAVEGKDTDFKAESPVWGKSVGGALVENKEVLYAAYIENKYVNSKYVDIDGNDVDKASFEAFLPASKPSTSQGTEVAIKYRKVTLTNILKVELI